MDRDKRSFVELCERAGYPTDLGGYYIRQLTKGGYIEKLERGSYGILPKGKQQLALHYGKHMFGQRPRLAVLVVAEQTGRFIVLRRRVQPFMDTAEWPAGALELGERLPDAARRVLYGRTGIAEQPTLIGFFRRTDMYKDTIFDDKIFAVHTCTVPVSATLDATVPTGEPLYCTAAELSRLQRPAKSLLDIFEYVRSPQIPFVEQTYHLALADLSSDSPNEI